MTIRADGHPDAQAGLLPCPTWRPALQDSFSSCIRESGWRSPCISLMQLVGLPGCHLGSNVKNLGGLSSAQASEPLSSTGDVCSDPVFHPCRGEQLTRLPCCTPHLSG